jgi:LPS-assembly protein
MNVGGRATVKFADGRGGSVLLGRSLRTKVDPLMPTRAGLDQKASDWIVAATVTPIRGINAFTRARFDDDTSKLNRLEAGVDASIARGFGVPALPEGQQGHLGLPPGKPGLRRRLQDPRRTGA